MRPEVAVAAADRGAQPRPVGRVELVQLRPAPGPDGNREHHLDPVHGVLVDQAPQHRRLNRAEEHRHERMRHDRKPALVMDRLDRAATAEARFDFLECVEEFFRRKIGVTEDHHVEEFRRRRVDRLSFDDRAHAHD